VATLEVVAGILPAPGRTTAVLVLGMHRSGTSSLTALINRLGVTVGPEDELVQADKANERGYWESSRLTDFQELLLRQLGGSWHSPPPLEGSWQRSPRLLRQVGRGRRIFKRIYGDSDVWAWKDPRTALTLPFWRRALRPRVLAIVIHRNPLEVARSLAARDHLSKEASLALWERYNRELIANARGFPALVVAYEQLVRNPVDVTMKTHAFLKAHGVNVSMISEQSVIGLIDAKLRHTAYTDEDIRSDLVVTPAQRELAEYLHSLEGTHEHFGL
jgi:hypothetical protein